MVSFPGDSAMGLGRVGASVQGRGKGSRKGKWGVCRKREGWETGEIFYQGKSRKNQYLHASACFLMSWKELEHFDFNHLECGLEYTVFSNAMKGT